jgi:hypothetical protein
MPEHTRILFRILRKGESGQASKQGNSPKQHFCDKPARLFISGVAVQSPAQADTVRF